MRISKTNQLFVGASLVLVISIPGRAHATTEANQIEAVATPNQKISEQIDTCVYERAPIGTDWTTIANSRKGRPIRARRIGDGLRRVLVLGQIHGNEPEGKEVAKQLPKQFTEKGVGATTTLVYIEDPDGSAAGTRENANGIDLNRNFPARNFAASKAHGPSPASEPETCALVGVLENFQPELVIALHSHSKTKGINYDGPAKLDAQQFSDLSGLDVVENSDLSADGHPGSLGQWWGLDQQKKILTVEYARGSSPERNWASSSDALLTAIGGSNFTGLRQSVPGSQTTPTVIGSNSPEATTAVGTELQTAISTLFAPIETTVVPSTVDAAAETSLVPAVESAAPSTASATTNLGNKTSDSKPLLPAVALGSVGFVACLGWVNRKRILGRP
jgi:murein peptide amidase A